jgi:deoxyribodipyrimidine photo-lyase
MDSPALVWFKRDLRVRDHAPLAAALGSGSVAALFVIEDEWLASPECDPQHLAFALQCLQELRASLREMGVPLLLRRGQLPDVFTQLQKDFPFRRLLSHEETGNGWTYARDLRVGRWCREAGVAWEEFPQTGVIRRLEGRNGWAARWEQRMRQPVIAAPRLLRGAQGLREGHLPTLHELGLGSARPLPSAGETAGKAVLESFLDTRGRIYRSSISSPLTAWNGCSRLSAHLAFGTLSMRCIYQQTRARIAALRGSGDLQERRVAWHLEGFAARLHWHCHFMQKLEDEPAIEFRNFSRACDGLREEAFDQERFEAWRAGMTGFPMVDACMRSLNATGWLNFRMRAMLVSFAAYHLWLHWREPGIHLARQFLDFEPGIHWSQMQMQSGTTGINTLRIYSPAKQAADHDPTGAFVRQWVPEYGTSAYPRPIIDEREAVKRAKERLYGLRKTDTARSEASAIQQKHGSRKSGLPQTGKTRRKRGGMGDARQAELFD